MDSLERRYDAGVKKARGGDKEAKEQIAVMEPALAALREGIPARKAAIDPALRPVLKRLQLMTEKPVLYVCNVEESSAGTGNAWEFSVRKTRRVSSDTSSMIAVKAGSN